METGLYDRVKYLCDINGITIAFLERELGFSSGAIGKWAGNKRSPISEKVADIAKYFKVSADYLLGLSSIRQPAEDLLNDSDLIAIQRARERLSPSDNKKMTDILRAGFEEAFKED